MKINEFKKKWIEITESVPELSGPEPSDGWEEAARNRDNLLTDLFFDINDIDDILAGEKVSK